MLSDTQMNAVLSLDLPEGNGLNTKSKTLSYLLRGLYSKKSSLYYNDFDKETQILLDNIVISIKPRLEKQCGKKLNQAKSDFRAVLLRYEGNDCSFGWHYDSEPDNCYRTLTLIKKEGIIPQFMYKTQQSEIKTLDFNVGDGIFFKGTQTQHKVERTTDPNSVRWMLGFQYCSGEYSQTAKSLTSELRGSNLTHICDIFVPRIITFTLMTCMIDAYLYKFNIDYTIYLYTSAVIILSSFIIPKYTNTTYGTGIVSTPYSLLLYYMILVLFYFNPQIAIGHYAYLLLTNMILPSNML